MKFAKIVLGLVVAATLLMGGFTAGSFITQTRAASVPVQQFVQPTFPQQQYQATAISQAQTPSTTNPQTTSPITPPQEQWKPGMWMTLAPGASAGVGPEGEWEHGWMMDPNYVLQRQQGWGMMHDWNDNNWSGMHGGMTLAPGAHLPWRAVPGSAGVNGYGNGWQSDPNWNLTPTVPNSSPSYPTPSTSSVSFRNNVQPIFTARCVACHGGTNGLSLDSYENVMKGGNNGAVVLAGDVYNSRLAYYVYSGYMPFRNTPLTSTEIQTILDWIALGAPNN